ncbi:MAG: TIGR03617 family F420-dependent LLM class oxidoreductase [Acidimicrobiia bacterium]|nr:TIGR03617 family F420-dependent LLM class oxidoreductase [Acidimicrobiia bacterium]
MKVDAYVAPEGATGVADAARRAVRLGYDGVMVPELRSDPFVLAAEAARTAPSLTVGTAVAVAFARSPMTVAYAARDLADLTSGRFVLGLGTQVRAHVVHRFSMPWSSPVARFREYLAALRAIWDAWQHGTPLRFRGEHYRFALMTPAFDPGPPAHGPIPIAVAGVGPGMADLAGETADGLHVHPFHTVSYLREVVAPAIAAGAARSGRTPGDVERICSVMVATGTTSDELERARAEVRRQIAFYASTPSYRGVLEHHGWGDVGPRLTAMSKRGEWAAMADVLPEDLVEAVAVVAPVDELAGRLRERYDGVLDRIGLYPGVALAESEERAVVAGLRGVGQSR